MPVRAGTSAWVLHRYTAALLILLLGAHFWVLHFVPANAIISFAGVAARLRQVLFWVIDYGLLLAGLYHGLNGLRNIALDYWPRVDRGLSWVLLAAGIAAAIYGGLALRVFIYGI
ncbi:MAG: succinate dehydrogenase/fumarate reductase transmembrane subunit [Symbiobacteriia bacterium]